MITAIIQARMNSSRFPGKILMPLGGTTTLGHTLMQVRKAVHIGDVVIATSNESSDDATEKHAQELGAKVFRGSLDDVLDRFYRAAKTFHLEHVCRITADCPVIDPRVIDSVAVAYEAGGVDYVSTGRASTTFPDGMDTEIFSFSSLERAWNEAKLPSEREHVTPYIWRHPEIFRISEITNDRDLSSIRLTLDEPQDYALLQQVVANVPDLSMNAIVEYLDANPVVASLNKTIGRDEGYARSLKNDMTI